MKDDCGRETAWGMAAAKVQSRMGEEDFDRMTKESRKIMWTATGVMTAVLLLVMFVTHRTIPFMMDDLWYATMLSDDTPIASFSDIVKSQIWHYLNWGGRSMTHGILQLTLLAGEPVADVLNIGFTLLLGWTICLVAGHRRFPAFFAAMALPLGLNANWRMSMFWQAGAANYLYITVFILGFAHCYLRELPEEGEDVPKALPGITLWILPLGILAGWSNENMGPAVWILSLAVILMGRKEGHRTKPWMILGNLACLAGSILCIAAPGNAVRSSQIKEEQYGVLWRIFLRSYGECKGAMEYLFPVILVLGAMLLVSRFALGQRLSRRDGLLLFTALLSWGAFFLSPHYPDRASFGTMALCVCVILSLAKRILRQRGDLAWPLWWGAVLIGLRGMYFCGEFLALDWGWIR